MARGQAAAGCGRAEGLTRRDHRRGRGASARKVDDARHAAPHLWHPSDRGLPRRPIGSACPGHPPDRPAARRPLHLCPPDLCRRLRAGAAAGGDGLPGRGRHPSHGAHQHRGARPHHRPFHGRHQRAETCGADGGGRQARPGHPHHRCRLRLAALSRRPLHQLFQPRLPEAGGRRECRRLAGGAFMVNHAMLATNETVQRLVLQKAAALLAERQAAEAARRTPNWRRASHRRPALRFLCRDHGDAGLLQRKGRLFLAATLR